MCNKPYTLLFMASSIMVINAEGVFKESDWIGVHKKYQDVPVLNSPPGIPSGIRRTARFPLQSG